MIQKQQNSPVSSFFLFLILCFSIASFVMLMIINNTLKEFNENLATNKVEKETLTSQSNPDGNLISNNAIDSDPEVEISQDQENDEEEPQNEDEEGNDENNIENENQESSTSQLENADYTSQKLFEKFNTELESASNELQNKKITVSGEVNEISETSSQKVNVSLKAGSGSLACLSRKGDENTAENIKAELGNKKEVVVEGVVDGFFEDEIELENCSIIFK